MLYEKSLYLNKDIPYLFSNDIIEYDIQSAGFNICREFKLLPVETLNRLEAMGKLERSIELGYIQKADSEFTIQLNNGFKEARKLFFEANHIKNNDILSIKKDAIYVLKVCNNTNFGHIKFVPKNKYSSYIYLNKLEFYIGNEKMDIKGIHTNKLELHREYMLSFIYDILKSIESSHTKRFSINKLVKFSNNYKSKKLDINFYRELNTVSKYRLKDTVNKRKIYLDDIQDINEIDISYNLINYIIPMSEML
jgi:hypothetical protein